MIFQILVSGLLAFSAVAADHAQPDPRELGLIATTAALCGETKLYLSLQEQYQLNTEYEEGKREGMKDFPTSEDCRALKSKGLFEQVKSD